MLPFLPIVGAVGALTMGQKLVVKSVAKVVIATGTALGAASTYSKIVNGSAEKTAKELKGQLENFENTSKDCDDKVANGEITEAEAFRIVLKAKDGILSAEDVAKLQKSSRKKSAAAATGIAGLGAVASVGADVLIDKYL